MFFKKNKHEMPDGFFLLLFWMDLSYAGCVYLIVTNCRPLWTEYFAGEGHGTFPKKLKGLLFFSCRGANNEMAMNEISFLWPIQSTMCFLNYCTKELIKVAI